MTPLLSVIVPVFNEEAVLPAFHRALTAVLGPLGIDYEILFVNDGSTDGTAAGLDALRGTDERVKFLEFSRNFGHQSAMAAGLAFARGRACVVMDADLQDPPELLPRMLELWRGGHEVVFAVRRSRSGETPFKKITAHVFYRLLRVLAGVDIPPDTGDFRLMDRSVVDAVNALPERNRFMRGLVSWIGFRQIGLPFDRPPRAAGETKFSVWKMFRFAVDGLTSFSHVPLRMVTLAGFAAFLGSAALLSWVSYVKFLSRRTVPGWTSLIGVILLLGGAQLLALGVIGEYIARIFDEAKRRPLYLVRRSAGIPGDASGEGRRGS